jgi:uncharacterized protein YqhQ
MEDKIITYGGQAVIEGVMMRGRKAFAIAMRAPDGNIVVHKESLASVYRSKITTIPFLRGIILLWDALGLGIRALTLSANTQTGEDEKLEGPALYLTLGISLAIGIGLFFLLPAGGTIPQLESLASQSDRRGDPVAPADRLYLGNRFHAGCQAALWLSWGRAQND